MTNQPVTPVTDDDLPVTLVTAGAGRPEDDAVFMTELLDLRAGLTKQLGKKPSIAQMLELLGEPPSRKGFWSHRLADPPTRTTFPPEAREAIRRAVGEAPAPPVTEVTERMISPGAAMHWIGPDTGEKSELVLMVAPGLGHIEIHANGSVSAKRTQGDLSAFAGEEDKTHTREIVTRVTGQISSQEQNQNARSARKYYRPALPVELRERVEASGVSVESLIEVALKAIEKEASHA